MTGRHAAAFLGFVQRIGAGPRGFAADVDQVGSLVHHPDTRVNRGGGIEQASAVGKRIRRDIDHAHDQSAVAKDKAAATR